jgi:hypothetical protein
MNKGELKTAILTDCHREDLTAEADRFVREGEGLIRRGLKYSVPLTVTLDETDRVSEGVYTLPSGLLIVRAVYTEDAPEGAEQVSLASIRSLLATAAVVKFCVVGDTIEFRGVPGTDEEIELNYMGMPAALDGDSDTNDLLTDHETLYKSAASFYLYKHTQDLELAQGELDTFTAALDALNEQLARKLGGATIAPAYYFGPIYRGY